MSTGQVSLDPYKNSRFRVMWDGRYVAGISRVSGLKRTTSVVSHRESGEPGVSRKSPGETQYDSITLERGLTQDPAFDEWAKQVFNLNAGGVSTASFRKDVRIELLNEAGQIVLAYKVYRCWVSEYQALPDLDAGGNAVAIEQIRLENEGWERDTAVASPAA
jgi:phage tail-like protein